MLCTICKSEMPDPNDLAVRAICERCLTAAKNKTRNEARPRKRRNSRNQQPEVVFAGSQNRRVQKSNPQSNLQAIKSAQAVAKAWSNQKHSVEQANFGTRKLRVDSPHLTNRQNNSNSDTPGFISTEPRSQSIASIRNAVSFGLLVFLLGQVLSMGAFLVGHFAAWSIGVLLSIGGVTVSLLSVNEALRRLDRRSDGHPVHKTAQQDHSSKAVSKDK